MSIIRIPEPITNITNTTIMANKSIEVTDLEAHVLVCSMRYSELEDRINRLETKIDDMIARSEATNKLIIRTVVSMIAGGITSLIVTHFNIL